MKHSVPIAMAIALVAGSSTVQAGPVAQQSSDDLVCKLSGDCGAADAAAASDKPATRGFSIARTQPARPAVTPAQPPRAAVAQPRRSSVRQTAPSARIVTPRQTMPRQTVAAAPGRADLMISFVSGSAVLTEQAKANANQFIAALASPKLAGMRFAIEGHTDAVGSRELNLDLSQRRAQAVVAYLTEKGVNRSLLDVHGYGFDRPLDTGNPRSPSNRRVEVVKAD